MSPFAQGYAFAIRRTNPQVGDAPFARATLTRILADCERFRMCFGLPPDYLVNERAFQNGVILWVARKHGRGVHMGFEPLTVHLSDTQEVYLS